MKKPSVNKVYGDKALEMVMRDVQDGLAEAACASIYQFSSTCIDILSIEAEKPLDFSSPPAVVIPVSVAEPVDVARVARR